MHEFGRHVIQAFFELKGKTLPEYGKVDVNRQYKNIDVFATIETPTQEKWAIIIENKIYTSEHSEQLKRYWELVQDEENDVPEERMIGIYYKMWEQSDMSRVKKREYAHFDRKSMLDLMESHTNEIENDIFLDYYDYLKKMQYKLDSFETEPFDQWGPYQWTGFYSKLKKDLDGVEGIGNNNFGYIPNAQGGFWGYWFGGHTIDYGNTTLYAQSESGKLCFKLNVEEESERQHAKWFWHDRVKGTGEEIELKVVKPKVMRVGRWFTIGVLKTDNDQYWMPTKSDGKIDYSASLELIKKSIKLVQKCVDDYGDEYLVRLN